MKDKEKFQNVLLDKWENIHLQAETTNNALYVEQRIK